MASDQSPFDVASDTIGTDIIPVLGGPDRRIDAEVHRRYRHFTVELRSGPISGGLPVPCYTNSLDAVIDLIDELLPGWTYGVATGALTDDVWIMPAAQGNEELGHAPEAFGLRTSFAPSPRAAINLLAVLIEVKAARDEQRPPLPDVPAARELYAAATSLRKT